MHMTLSKKDLDAMRAVFRDEIDTLRREISTRFDGVMEQLDGLYQPDEKREQELLPYHQTELTTRKASF